METSHDANTIEGYTIEKDNIVKENETARMGLLTVTEKGGESSEAKITVTSAELQTGLFGIEAEISFQLENYEDYEEDK